LQKKLDKNRKLLYNHNRDISVPLTILSVEGVLFMYARNDVTMLRKNISQHVGSKVMLETNKGRQKSIVSSGTIENAYPSIFTVMLDGTDGTNRTVSFSYTDVLTKSVEITVFSH